MFHQQLMLNVYAVFTQFEQESVVSIYYSCHFCMLQTYSMNYIQTVHEMLHFSLIDSEISMTPILYVPLYGLSSPIKLTC